MRAESPFRKPVHVLPDCYSVSVFSGSEEDIAGWKRIMMDPPSPPDGADSCYHLMIETYPDVVPEKDIFFIVSPSGEKVASFTAVTHKDGSGYLHMVKARLSERGKGLGHVMAEKAVGEFSRRGCKTVILTTDDFRLPAIKTYLDAGFQPVIEDEEDKARWKKVIEDLDYPSGLDEIMYKERDV